MDLKGFFAKSLPFKGLPSQELDHLSRIAQERKHPKGEYIFLEGDEATSVWILISGRLDIYKFTSDGKPHGIETIQPGDLFGTLCRFGSQGKTYPCTAKAAIDSKSARIPDSTFMNLFKRYPSVLNGICTLCSTRLNEMQDLSCNSQESVEKRIARTLTDMTRKYGNTLKMTKREIADFSGTTVETTIRIMSKMQKSQWISSSRGQIQIKEPDKIAGLLK